MKQLDAARLREVLTYDPLTGRFRWNGKPNGRVAAGAHAGTVDAKGYRRIQIDGAIYHAGPLAVLFMTGEWPAPGMEVDHEDEHGPKDDNRWSNLRVLTKAQNQQNLRSDARGSLKRRGVSFHKSTGKFIGYVTVAGRRHHLGLFVCPDLAEEFVALARTMCMPHAPENRNV